MKYIRNNSNLPEAVHIDGYNHFDNMALDIHQSHERLDARLHDRKAQKKISRSKIGNFLAFRKDALLHKSKLYAPVVNTGLESFWFEEFEDYWLNALSGRPVGIPDFFSLYFNYRQKAQHSEKFDWSTVAVHLENWQTPENIAAVFFNIYKCAANPITAVNFKKYVTRNSRVLEYGCSAAPGYRTYRRYFSHLNCKFTLLDIPGFSFHYAKWAYWEDDAIEDFVTVWNDMFDDPLKSITHHYDAVILHNVFEHLDHPHHIIQYISNRMNKGGVLFFDYIDSHGDGHDTIGGVDERVETLEYIKGNFDILEGDFSVTAPGLGKIVARKK